MHKTGHILSLLTVGACLAATALGAAGCGGDDDAVFRMVEGEVWSSTFCVEYRSPRSLDDSVVEAIHRVDHSLSLKHEQGVLTDFNSGEDDHVDTIVVRCVKESQAVHRLSGGRYDPSARRLIDLWRDYHTGKTTSPPSEQAIAEARAVMGIDGCHALGTQLAKTHPQMQLDFSAIIRGMGARQIRDMLLRNGVTDYYIRVGDEAAVSGDSPVDKPWKVPIVSSEKGLVRYVRMARCVISSATQGQPLIKGPNTTISTFVDPTTGRMAATDTYACTVISSQRLLMCDALATAVMVMPPAEGLAMIEGLPGFEALIVKTDGTTLRTPGWDKVLERRGYPLDNRKP